MSLNKQPRRTGYAVPVSKPNERPANTLEKALARLCLLFFIAIGVAAAAFLYTRVPTMYPAVNMWVRLGVPLAVFSVSTLIGVQLHSVMMLPKPL